MLQFAIYKGLGEVLLDEDHTHQLCEGVEGAGVRLAVMLASDHVTHVRDDVIQWAGRLSRVEDLLTQVVSKCVFYHVQCVSECVCTVCTYYIYTVRTTYAHIQWLVIQEQWKQLESVFSSSSDSLVSEAAQFDAVTASWAELMDSARASPGVLEWCEGGEGGGLVKLREQLELCKKSLSLYLLSKREVTNANRECVLQFTLQLSLSQIFPRLFFLTDDALLQILSSPLSPPTLTPHLPSLFTNTRSLVTSRTPSGADEGAPVFITAVESAEQERLELTESVRHHQKLNVHFFLFSTEGVCV